MGRVRVAAVGCARVKDVVEAVLRETGLLEHAAREDAARPLGVGSREGHLRWVVEAAAHWGAEEAEAEAGEGELGGMAPRRLREFLAHMALRDRAGAELLADSTRRGEESIKLLTFGAARGLQLRAAMLARCPPQPRTRQQPRGSADKSTQSRHAAAGTERCCA